MPRVAQIVCRFVLLAAIVSFQAHAELNQQNPEATALAPPEARMWLDKMTLAYDQQTFSGTFTYMRGSEFNTMRIVHDARGEAVKESLVRLNGPRIEVRRSASGIVCFHDTQEPGNLRHDVLLGPFSQAFHSALSESGHHYQLTLHGEDRVADRRAMKLAIQPINSARLGYLLWLDYETGLLLQSHLVEGSQVKEIFSFSSIDFEPAAERLAAELKAIDPENRVSHLLVDNVIDQERAPPFRVKWLPKGFKQVHQAGNRLLFSDGLVTFSVFFGPSGDMPNVATEVEGRTVVTQSLGSKAGQVTVIGGVPVLTAKKLAESVEPILY